jgi:hypothetical protein
MMTPEDRVRAGNVVLVFDAANVPARKLFGLASDAKNFGVNLRLVVPVTAHAEKLMDLRQHKGASYSAEVVRQALRDAEVEILSLDAEAAESVAARLWNWFPRREDWLDAKWKRLRGDERRSAHQRPPATIDWYTAAMCPPGAIVVTDDTGAEFRACDVIRSAALEAILRELSASSGTLTG